MTKKKRKIVSIDIELEDFEPIHLKMDEAKELYEQLHDLFGKDEVVQNNNYYPFWQRPYYNWYGNSNHIIPLQSSTSFSSHSNVVGQQASSNVLELKAEFEKFDTTAKVVSDKTNMAVTYNTA